jgi:transposase
VWACPCEAVIPPLSSRTAEIAYDKNAYGLRYRIECFINKINHYRRIATRYEKTARNFLSLLGLAAAGLASRSRLNQQALDITSDQLWSAKWAL